MSLIKKASRLATLCMMFLMNKRSLPQPLRKEGSPIRSLEDKQGDYCKSSANRALPLSGELEGAGAWGGFFLKLKKNV